MKVYKSKNKNGLGQKQNENKNKKNRNGCGARERQSLPEGDLIPFPHTIKGCEELNGRDIEQKLRPNTELPKIQSQQQNMDSSQPSD